MREKAGLPRDAIRSQCSTCSKHKEKEIGNGEANDLERDFPEDTSVRFNYLPAIRASLTLDHGDPSKAIELLQVAVPYEISSPRSATFAYFGALYPVYVRGQA